MTMMSQQLQFPGKEMSEITVEDTFSAVIRLRKLKYNVVALDFASGSNPGGGWRGKQRGTQEEHLC